MKNPRLPEVRSLLPKPASYSEGVKIDNIFQGLGATGMKRRGQTSRSWIKIDSGGNSEPVTLDKAALMKQCGLPSRDLRLLDPLFVYPSTILGREKAIVVSLEQVRCIIMADYVLLMNSLDSSILQYQSYLCQRLQLAKEQDDDLPFEFKALEIALELACASLDCQVTELEKEIYPVLEELAASISSVNLEQVRRLKSTLLSLNHRVQKVHDEIEQLMDDDGDMAEMYLTEKRERMDAFLSPEGYLNIYPNGNWVSKSTPVSPASSSSEPQERNSAGSPRSFSRRASSRGSSNRPIHVEELEMLLEAYFVVIGNSLSKLLSLKEYIDDTEDFINIKLDNVRNQLIQLELLLTAATFVVTIFAVVTGVFGMNFEDAVFDVPSNFNVVVVATSICCVLIFLTFLLYIRSKKFLPA